MNIVIQYNQKHLVALIIVILLIGGGIYWIRSTQVQTQIAPTKPSTNTTTPTPQTADGIDVDVTRLPQSIDGTSAFRIALNTHSGDLSTFDAATNVLFRAADGVVSAPSNVGGDRETHHRTIEVAFKKPIFPGTLIINNLGSLKERPFEFSK